MQRLFLFVCSLFIIINSSYTQLPSSDILLFNYSVEGDSMQLKNAKFLTGFNQGSYNNQPNFFSYNDLYLTCYNKEEDQTDIVHLDIANEKLYEVTRTKESEYSPTLMPGKEYLSCIKAYKDENTTQLLWKYPMNKSNRGGYIFRDIKNIGYHFWIDSDQTALFLVGPPHKLAFANTTTKRSRLILENIGRTFKRSKDGKLLFVHKVNETLFYIKEYDPDLRRATIVGKTLEGIEDFEILDDGSLVSGKGSDLYRFVPGESVRWTKVASLERFNIKDIGRISSFFDRIAIVSRNTQ